MNGFVIISDGCRDDIRISRCFEDAERKRMRRMGARGSFHSHAGPFPGAGKKPFLIKVLSRISR